MIVLRIIAARVKQNVKEANQKCSKLNVRRTLFCTFMSRGQICFHFEEMHLTTVWDNGSQGQLWTLLNRTFLQEGLSFTHRPTQLHFYLCEDLPRCVTIPSLSHYHYPSILKPNFNLNPNLPLNKVLTLLTAICKVRTSPMLSLQMKCTDCSSMARTRTHTCTHNRIMCMCGTPLKSYSLAYNWRYK